MSAPPPPPPHGEMPRSGGLPPGKYDIFVIPEHSAGSGFLYLPSLQPNINSFVAGFASALILVALFQSMAPAFRAWWESFQGLGNMGITLLIVGVGFGAWALGRIQNDKPSTSSSSGPKPSNPPPGSGPAPGSTPGAGGYSSQNAPPPPPPPRHETPPPPPPPNGGTEKPQSSWQRPPPQTNQRPENPKPSAKGSWEKARDEMRKKEEERKAKEAEQKRREDLAKRLAELRAKEAKERVEREKEKQRKEKEAADKKEKEAKAAAEKAKAAAPKPAPSVAPTQTPSPTANRAGSSYAFSGVGEKMSMWPNGKPPAPASPTPKAPPSPTKKPPAPTARTYVSTDEDGFSYRPYDKPRRPQRRNSGGSMMSDGSWAPSHTTARTSPPPSTRGPYTTKDPDKIVIQAVYLFMNQYAKTPASQLISGVGSVTDGLILRITTEGLFIDDDVRGVPQREWDVKAWTLKMVEVWCPPHCLNSASASASSPNPNNKSANLLYKMATGRARNADRDPNKPLVGEEADAYLTDMLKACKDCCRLGLCEQKFGKTNAPNSTGQAGEWKARGLHLLRATVRDQDGKRYLFVIDETENWKVGASLQRLRRGAQARQLGICSMTSSEAKNSLETLGWAN